jgi:uncharacterized protein YndB with AHSA1/START domain
VSSHDGTVVGLGDAISMTSRSVQLSIRIRAKPNVVWATLLDATKIARWMGGAHVESTWQPGSAITFTGTLNNRPYQDRGTVLVCEPERVLRYSHWSSWSRRVDSEETRTVITLTVTAEDDAETVLEVRHDNLTSDGTLGHASFFWRNALADLKILTESG